MTPFQFAHDECANYVESKGSCLGVQSLIPEPDKPTSAHPLSKCLLADNQRCAYFERAVLPLADRGNPKFLKAREIYFTKALRAEGLTPRAELTSPRCECGKPKAAGARFCQECKIAKRRASYRASKKQVRGDSDVHS